MDEELERAGEEDASLAARVNERHDGGESLFVEPTPREIHEIMEEAASDEPGERSRPVEPPKP